MPPWTTQAEIKKKLERLWQRGDLLRSVTQNTELFPLRVPLKKPSSQNLSEKFSEVQAWVKGYQKVSDYEVEWREINHRTIGKNRLPVAVLFDSLPVAVRCIGKQKDLALFQKLLKDTGTTQPGVVPWVESYPLKVLALAKVWARLMSIIDWFKHHPYEGIYIRQIDIPGVHTKFIETHKATLKSLLDLTLDAKNINDKYSALHHFPLRYGLLVKPARIRLRVLDPDLKLLPGDSQDLTLTGKAFESLKQLPELKSKIRQIFITENEINFLSFPTLAGSMVLFGSGYGFDFLKEVSWLAGVNVYYWGDLDTHGFAILDQLRAHLPQTRSVLMDEETFLAHRDYWGTEEKPVGRTLTALTDAENRIYQGLYNNKWGENLRLEQEHVSFTWMVNALKKIEG